MARTPKPTILEKARENYCPNCGKPLPARAAGARGARGIFCPAKEGEKRSTCAVAHQNRRITEGAPIIALLKAWRIDRGEGEIAKEAFQQICAIADGFNAADREAGRPRADLFAAKLLADGTNFADRRPA